MRIRFSCIFQCALGFILNELQRICFLSFHFFFSHTPKFRQNENVAQYCETSEKRTLECDSFCWQTHTRTRSVPFGHMKFALWIATIRTRPFTFRIHYQSVCLFQCRISSSLSFNFCLFLRLAQSRIKKLILESMQIVSKYVKPFGGGQTNESREWKKCTTN